ncbi:hypothetical protein EDEG_00356 [Edhazardia aedis USNM 41457]|uniref:Methyltransferase type 11 domain-containing protein n=1 Tax=Edhazardia aedis (strain USNM 41457) TaxID=1003232 RepID=J9DGM9_EDHAE|nr:hypothetical protein EDEG_00356 [Edhazardia aedis USNM 41457]|eukprot:EJW01765.1 hypothetical protein EDEG_00356 [Edhazardia aedis USNM 41457]
MCELTQKSSKSKEEEFESKNVHAFYSNQAKSFSSTRYSLWPGIRKFIDTYYSEDVVFLDSGCGNGRNLMNGMYAMDYSKNLLFEAKSKIATRIERFNFKADDEYRIKKSEHKKQNASISKISKNLANIQKNNYDNEIFLVQNFDQKIQNTHNDFIRGDILNHPFNSETFDYIMSIAVIHHLSTRERRINALKDMLRILKPKGKILLYVWSSDVSTQSKFSKIKGINSLNSMSQVGDIVDIKKRSGDYLVTWGKNNDSIRYYYLYDIETLRTDCKDVGFRIEEICIEQESIKAILSKEHEKIKNN